MKSVINVDVKFKVFSRLDFVMVRIATVEMQLGMYKFSCNFFVVRCLFVVGTLFSEINVHVDDNVGNGCVERKPCKRENLMYFI